MDEPLGIDWALLVAEHLTLEIELDDIGGTHPPGRHRGRHVEVIAVARASKAHMTEAIDDTVMVENMIGGDEIIDQQLEIGFLIGSRRIAANGREDRGSQNCAAASHHHCIPLASRLFSSLPAQNGPDRTRKPVGNDFDNHN
jgi:hypothetical protein